MKVKTYILIVLIFTSAVFAQELNITFNKYYNYPELTQALKDLEKAYSKFLKLESVGKSVEGRDIWVMKINNPDTGDEFSKAAMYIDANIHGNEVQGGEICLYTIWYLMKNYEKIDKITELINQRVFYILPTVNPDGRAWWFDSPNPTSSSRGGKIPIDSDNDGLYDEDDYDDLNGDGEITQMRKKVLNGDYRIHHQDPRLMVRAGTGEVGEYILLGREGIDNDGDGRINEDGPGGYDPNRDWPANWQPNYIQRGAGKYPLNLPESQGVANFIKSHPNIAGAQAYHNSGGMILRPPGIQESNIPGSDIRVYDYIGREGEKMLPFYRYYILWKDLYTVWGGFLDWTYLQEGIFTFSNEIFSSSQYYNRARERGVSDRRTSDRSQSQLERLTFNDYLEYNDMHADWEPYNHPTYGEIEIGGWKRLSGRVNPLFLLEETCHRNAAFTLFHADQMPLLSIEETQVIKIDKDVYRVRVSIRNKRIIPTVAAQTAKYNLHRGDIAKIEGNNIDVVSAGIVKDKWFDKIDTIDNRPERLVIKEGISGNNTKIFQWIVKGKGKIKFSYDSLKGGKLFEEITLK